MRPNQTHKLLHSKETTSKMKRQPMERDNICKRCNQQGLNLPNTQTADTAQQKHKQPN